MARTWSFDQKGSVAHQMTHVSLSGFHRGAGNFYLWNPESGKFLLLESRTLSFGIRYSTQANRNPANGCNPESKFHAQSTRNLVSGIRNPRREIQNPKLCTGFFLSQCRDSLLLQPFLVSSRNVPSHKLLRSMNSRLVRWWRAENSLEKILEVNYHINTLRKNKHL